MIVGDEDAIRLGRWSFFSHHGFLLETEVFWLETSCRNCIGRANNALVARGAGASEMSRRTSFGLASDDQGQNHMDGSAIADRTLDAELALQLADTLAHAGNADAK